MGYEIKNLYRASYLEKPANKSREKIARELTGVFSIIKAILVFRITFNFFQIIPASLSTALETLSYPLVAPFYMLLNIQPRTTSELEWVSIFALATYSVLGFLIIQSLRSGIVSSPAEEQE